MEKALAKLRHTVVGGSAHFEELSMARPGEQEYIGLVSRICMTLQFHYIREVRIYDDSFCSLGKWPGNAALLILACSSSFGLDVLE